MRTCRLYAAAVAILATAASLPPAAQAASNELAFEVLSNRADLVSAGDALVALNLPGGTNPDKVEVTLNGKVISEEFAVRPSGRYEGLVEGLALGKNRLIARAGRRRASVTITNHPNGGPVTSGPQIQPWVCQATAVDAQCNQPVDYEFLYISTNPANNGFQPYDPENPPTDVATTTTDEGKTVPFIVRHETGYQDRDQYQTAVLYDPSKSFEPWAPQDGYNGKLLITHGSSCGIEHQAGTAPSVLEQASLGRGMAVMSTALDNAGHNCNIAVQAESLIMAKERLIEEYGPIRFTIGTGCSGGSLVQQQVSNAYPGLYQGITPACSFSDAGTAGQQLVDNHLLDRYLTNPTAWGIGVAWDPVSIATIQDHVNPANALAFETVFWQDLAVPNDTCAGVTAEQAYDPDTNPGGVRCDMMDYMLNVLGPREPEDWGPQEQQVGFGFAGLPFDNVGVEYGLKALKAGKITPAQFVDLNAKIGGLDHDLLPTAWRLRADEPALANSYRSGYINMTNNQAELAVIDLRGPDPGAFHDAYRTWATRARMEREQGHHPRNHVIWFGAVPLMGDPGYAAEAILAVDRWLTAVEADDRDVPLAQKIAEDRPADVQDRCSNVPGFEMVDVPGVGRVCEDQNVQTRYGTIRTAAGEAITTDQNKCQLKPLRREEYYPVKFTDAQWNTLEATFADGVCDWTKPGVDETGTIPWLTYQNADGSVVYGGKPLGAAPAGSGTGWASGSFGSWRDAIVG